MPEIAVKFTIATDDIRPRAQRQEIIDWKSLKEYLKDQGLLMNIAFAACIIHDEDAWNAALKACNMTSHVYDEATADEIAHRICSEFMAPFTALAKFYSE